MTWYRRLACLALIGLLAQAAAPRVGGAVTNAGFRDFRFGGSLSTPTGEKPESKLWWNDGSWWGSLWDPNANSYAIHRLDLDTQSWVSTGTLVDTRSSSRADALWDGDHLYIVSHIFTTNAGSTGSGNSGRLYRYAYHAGTRSYSLDPGFPVNVNASKSEALVIAKDSSGRLWVTWVEGGKVKVNRTLGDDLSWGQPFDLPGQGADVTTDDISGIAAFGTDRVGLMWSNQADHKMYFAAHLDGGADMQWEPREDALADATLGQMADDHINLKMSCDGSGAVYAVTKTGLTNPTDPLVLVLRRQAGGAWSRHVFGTVAENHTRPILCIDRDAGTAYVFAMSDRTGRRVIYEKRASLADLGFPSGLGTPFIDSPDDPAVSNPTSTKQCVGRASGLVVLASDQDTQYYLHNYLSLVPPPSIASFVPTDGPVGGEVTLTGTGFSGATAVEFNGTPAASYIVDSDAQIRATVPPGATTGRIVVTTPAGSGLSGSDFTVILSPTTTVLQSSANPSTWGAQVVLEATVAPAAATGTVRFFDGVTPLGTAPVSGGLATLSVDTLAVGRHELTASYDGDAWYAGSSSAPWSQSVDFASSTTVLDAQPAETHCAEAVTLSAAVSPATATRTVQFYDGLNPIGPPQPVSDGVATLSWTDLPAGTHTLIAKYSGDGRYGPSQSDAIPHDVIASATATTLVSDPNPSAWGGKVDLRATVDRGAATGTVEFFDGATSLGTAPVSDGVVLLSVSHLSVGTHELTADYGGDACFAGSRSAAMSQVVNVAATTATLNVEPAATGWGQAVGLSAAVDPAAATGTVQFWDGLNPIGPPQPVMDGVATLSWMDLSVGSHALVAKYSGDDYYEPSQSQAVPHDVASGSSIVSLDAQPAQTQCGETVRLSAVVDPAAASGTVQFCDGLDPIGPPQAVSDGVATLSWTDLPAGTHTLIAKYSGDGSYGPSQSDAVSHEVNPIPTATTLGSNANPARFGTEVILTAQVGLGGASGTMRFFDQTGLIGSAPADPQSGVAALSVSDLAVGHHSLVARYDGDGCHAASSSPAYEQDVVPDNPPSVTVIAPNGGESLTVGQTVTLSWDARDDGPLPAVTLCVSRDDGATYEVIAADVPNSGTYAWTVTPPGTYRDASPLYSALLQVKARDAAGQAGSDVSDAPFAIFEPGHVAVDAPSVKEFALSGVWPNPMRNERMRVEFAVAEDAPVRLSVLDLQGREVQVLAEGPFRTGRYHVELDGTTARGRAAAGIYFVRYVARGRTMVRRFARTP